MKHRKYPKTFKLAVLTAFLIFTFQQVSWSVPDIPLSFTIGNEQTAEKPVSKNFPQVAKQASSSQTTNQFLAETFTLTASSEHRAYRTFVNEEGDSLVQEFDANGRVSKITNITKNTITTFQYQDSMEKYTITSGPTVWTFTYGKDNQPATEDDVLVSVGFVNEEGDRLVHEFDARGRITESTNITKNTIATFRYDDSNKRYTLTSGTMVQTITYGLDNEAGTDDDILMKVGFEDAVTGDSMVLVLNAQGRIINIINVTKDTAATFRYDDMTKQYTVTSGTIVQTIAYGSDNEPGTADDWFVQSDLDPAEKEKVRRIFNDFAINLFRNKFDQQIHGLVAAAAGKEMTLNSKEKYYPPDPSMFFALLEKRYQPGDSVIGLLKERVREVKEKFRPGVMTPDFFMQALPILENLQVLQKALILSDLESAVGEESLANEVIFYLQKTNNGDKFNDMKTETTFDRTTNFIVLHSLVHPPSDLHPFVRLLLYHRFVNRSVFKRYLTALDRIHHDYRKILEKIRKQR